MDVGTVEPNSPIGEGALVLRFEASSPDRLEEIRSIVESKLEEVRQN